MSGPVPAGGSGSGSSGGAPAGAQRPGWVFLFPGQGAQAVGMGADLAEAEPEARAVFQEADRILGYPLSRLMFEGPADTLTRTVHAQPALLTASVAAARVLAARGVTPVAVAGHSVGEYSALVVAGALPFDEALRLVQLRGRLMEAAAPAGTGAMGAILGLDPPAVEALCREVREAEGAGVVEPANFNAPDQVVVSGELRAVRRVLERAREQGASRTVELPVSGPFHSSLMQPVAAALLPALAAAPWRDPGVPVVANVTGRPVVRGADWPDLLARQVCSPVLWEASCRYLLEAGYRHFLEVGPGRVLSGLLRRVARALAAPVAGVTVATAGDREGLAKVVATPKGDSVR